MNIDVMKNVPRPLHSKGKEIMLMSAAYQGIDDKNLNSMGNANQRGLDSMWYMWNM